MEKFFYSTAPSSLEEANERATLARSSGNHPNISKLDWERYFTRQFKVKMFFEKFVQGGAGEWFLTESILKKADLAFEPIERALAGFTDPEKVAGITKLNPENLQILKNNSRFLEGLSDDTLNRFIDNFIFETIEDGRVLSKASCPNDKVYIIVSGLAHLFFGGSAVVAEIGMGHFVGNTDCLFGISEKTPLTSFSHHTVVANTSLKVLVASEKQVRDFSMSISTHELRTAAFRDISMKAEALGNSIMFGNGKLV